MYWVIKDHIAYGPVEDKRVATIRATEVGFFGHRVEAFLPDDCTSMPFEAIGVIENVASEDLFVEDQIVEAEAEAEVALLEDETEVAEEPEGEEPTRLDETAAPEIAPQEDAVEIIEEATAVEIVEPEVLPVETGRKSK